MFDIATAFLLLFTVTDCSNASLIRCVEFLFTQLPHISHSNTPVTSIALDQSWFTDSSVDLAQDSITAHTTALHYTFALRPSRPPNYTLAPELHALASCACSADDLFALHISPYAKAGSSSTTTPSKHPTVPCPFLQLRRAPIHPSQTQF
jgi:hypothetical protein